ncbi:Uncharacterised protein [Mycobacteroides abscessus subsp. abscessus]|nr:hypothetical protein [Mycobacteroides abscessus]MBE5456040.1 hypothetical protein [Mycobacteroides abscessus]MDO3046332.1 hypothetical protein [Mycobacteroides abscessus subsp. abscessus]MDO3137441.1 hypothetical protein [Mycobacteroides abscessus subsp. abscessus]MDO3155480.1 hypothetical protein [Mycobacteroides abscessus subsp. abscessus]CPS25242.1 Uncharacterised protein [Mycobacteroides abscessus]
MKSLVAAGFAALALLGALVAQADPQPWCAWSPELDVNSCGLIVGVPPSGQLVDGPGDWSTPELRTKG